MFQPVLPATGLTGWFFLKRTAETQQETLSQSGLVKRESEYFRENIGKVQSPSDLIEDRTLRKVALTAFGLEGDLNNKFFINRILDDGTTEGTALANQLSDKRYLAFAEGMGFVDGRSNLLSDPSAVERIIQDFQSRTFEAAVGEQDPNLRLALSLERELGIIAGRSTSVDTKWFSVMGNPPLRNIFESAMGLPSSFASIPIDDQLETLKARSESLFGTSDIADFQDPELQETLTRRFLLNEQLNANAFASGQSIALQLLQA
ncbi:MAG: DUF1217 domain-containing protein [Pseudomonadota bacterium]